MAITALQVKELRERTGTGMMECKKALTEANGDIDAAIAAMRKTGLAKADKKSGRIAAEGLISIDLDADNQSAAILEVNCETDFVARDENFSSFAAKLADTALTKKLDKVEDLLAQQFDGEQTFDVALKALIAKIGENMTLRRLGRMAISEGCLGAYIHGGRIGVLVHMVGGDEDLAKDVAMHIAASNPRVINPEDFPEDELAKEREIFEAKSKDSGKPAEIVEKMLVGQINKFLNQVSLQGQPFVKDPEVTVGQLLKSKKAEVRQFYRYEVGEGIEKLTTDFAEEVMAQVRGSA